MRLKILEKLAVVFGIFLLSAVPSLKAGERENVRAAVNHYFESWSAKDMAAYQACFHPDAVISYVSGDGQLIRSMLNPFIESQRLAHASSQFAMKEIPVKIEETLSENFASALVHWELTTATKVKKGVNVFTFVKEGDKWKIASLVFGDEG